MDTDHTAASAESKKGIVEWGGFASALRQDCGESANIGPKSADLLTRLDELAMCTSMAEIGVFANSVRSFAEPDRDYLNSPLLDEIYASLALKPLPVASRGAVQASSSSIKPAAARAQSVAPLNPQTASTPQAPVNVANAMPFACAMGYAAALAFFGERGAPLHTAIDVGVMNALRASRPPQRTATPYLGVWNTDKLVTPLQLSAAFGHVDCVRYVLEARGKAVPIDNSTFQYAIRGGDAEVIQLLIDAGADVHADECFQEACDACYWNPIAIVQLLVTAAAKTGRPVNLRPHLLHAVQRSQKALAKCLLDAGADIHADEEISVMCTVAEDNASMLRLLVERGANVRFNNDQALVSAAIRGSAPVIELLIESGSNVHARGDLPLSEAVARDHSVAVRSLLRHGADPRATVRVPPSMGVEPLRKLLDSDWNKCVPLLLEGGLPVDAVLPFVLETAIHGKHIELLDLMAERGADAIAIASARLVLAAKAGDGHRVEALLQAGAQPERFGNAALHRAIQTWHEYSRKCERAASRRFHSSHAPTLPQLERRADAIFDMYHHSVMLLLPRLATAQGDQATTIALLQNFLQNAEPHLVRVYLQALGTVVSSVDLNPVLLQRLVQYYPSADVTDAVAALLQYGADASSVPQQLLNECKAKGRMAYGD